MHSLGLAAERAILLSSEAAATAAAAAELQQLPVAEAGVYSLLGV